MPGAAGLLELKLLMSCQTVAGHRPAQYNDNNSNIGKIFVDDSIISKNTQIKFLLIVNILCQHKHINRESSMPCYVNAEQILSAPLVRLTMKFSRSKYLINKILCQLYGP